jgi:hypothetical protein
MSWGLVAVAVVAAGASAYSAYTQAENAQVAAQNQQYAADYQAMVDKNNAQIERYKREQAIALGEEKVQDALRQKADLISRQRALLGASGVDATQGSAIDLLATTEFYNQQDVNRLQANAAREAWGYDITTADAMTSSNLASWQARAYGSQARSISPGGQAVMAGAGSLLSSAGSYYAAKG